MCTVCNAHVPNLTCVDRIDPDSNDKASLAVIDRIIPTYSERFIGTDTNMSEVPPSILPGPKVLPYLYRIWPLLTIKFLQPLTSHATPYSLARVSSSLRIHSGNYSLNVPKIQSVPPVYRKKSDWYRNRMDPRIDNDTQGLHWTLSSIESRRLLEVIFPDDALFGHTTGPSQPLNMSELVDSLREQGLYQSSDKNKDGPEKWHQISPGRDKNSESKIARFFNSILRATEKVIGRCTTERLVFLPCHITHILCIDKGTQVMESQRIYIATQRLGR